MFGCRMFCKKEFLFLLLAMKQVVSRNADYCYANNKNQTVKFATRTAYHVVHGGKTSYESIPTCEPVGIWMLIRHGTRYLTQATVARLSYLLEVRNEIVHNHEVESYGQLCDEDLKNLKDWNPDYLAELGGTELSERGIKEMNRLGERTRSNFPELFPPFIKDVSSRNYEFKTTFGERVTSSCREFMLGLLGRVDISSIGPPDTDDLFASYEMCPKWETDVANNPEHLIEVTRFTEGPEYQELILNVSRRLGYSYNISIDWVIDIWDMCRHEKAWGINKVAPWCAVFTDKELRIIEYREDLVDYYKRGYGHEYNIRLGCPPMRDLFWHFERLENDDYSNEPKGVFNIGHSGSLHLFLAAMGFAEDSAPLLASDFRSRREYKWRTSEIGSFAANLAAVFYKCNDTDGSPNRVKFYLAEKPVSYEGCRSGLCDWEYLKNKFQNDVVNCNQDFCNPDTAILSPAVAIIIVLYVLSMITVFACRRWMPRKMLNFFVQPWCKFSNYFNVSKMFKI